MKTGFLKVENERILYDGIKMELFIPDEYFKTNLAEEIGTGYRVFGYARAYHYTDKSDDRTKATKSVLTYPLMMYTSPTSVSIEKINFGDGEEKYHVFTYYKDDIVMTSSEILQDANNVQVFYAMIMNGKLDIIEYRQIPRMFQLCKLYNGVSFDTPAMYEEVVIADYYRNPNDPSLPARYEAAVTDNPHFFAKGVTQREKVSYVSTFSSITFEDIVSMLTKADNSKREGREEIVSDVEKNTLGLT